MMRYDFCDCYTTWQKRSAHATNVNSLVDFVLKYRLLLQSLDFELNKREIIQVSCI